MKQVLQNLKTGTIELAEVPKPQLKEGHILVQSRTSLISAGTERMVVEFGKAGWIDKARQQPYRFMPCACPPVLWRTCPPAVWRACPPFLWRTVLGVA